MDCKEFREVLDLYVDQELSFDASTAARIHLNECSTCRRAERELIRLRRALKLVVSQHQPSADLVSAVRRITQPRWRRLFDITKRKPNAADVARARRSLWRETIKLPMPVFMLLVIAVVTVTVVFTRRRMFSAPPSAGVYSKTEAIKPADLGPPFEAADLSRFDHGGRASLYKELR